MKRNEILFIIEMYIACAITCTVMLGLGNLASKLIAVNYIIVMLIFGSIVSNQITAKKAKTLVALALIMVCSVIGVSVTGRGLSFDYMKKLIMFICTMTVYYCVNEVTVTKKMIKSYFIVTIIITLTFFYMYFSGNHAAVARGITFNLGNPNFTGICLLCTFLSVFLIYDFVDNKLYKFLIICTLAFLFYLIKLTLARSCLIAALAMIFMKLFYKGKYHKTVSFLVLIFPLVFAFLYLELVNNPVVMEKLDFLVSTGKSLTSRVGIWKRALGIIKDNLFFGNYYRATDGIGLGQLHNIMLDTLAAFGIVVFSMVIFLLNSILNQIGEKITHKYQLASIFAFYAVIFSGVFEAGMFSNSQGMYILTAGMLMLAKYDKTDTLTQPEGKISAG